MLIRSICRAQQNKYPFDAVYYINLARRQDRRNHIEKALHECDFHRRVPLVERFEAIDGTTIDVQGMYESGQISLEALKRYNDIPLEQKFYGMDLTPGALGCALSHRAVWKKIVQRKHKCALILEDDAEFSPIFQSEIASCMKNAPSDWELLYLGGVDLLSSGKPPRPMTTPGWRRAYSGQRELTAYVLHERSASICLELTNRLNWQIDTHLCEVCTEDVDYTRPFQNITKCPSQEKLFVKDSHSALDKFISKPMSYALHPTLVIQLSRFGTNVQKVSEAASGDAFTVDAKRRMREFYSGLTSVR